MGNSTNAAGLVRYVSYAVAICFFFTLHGINVSRHLRFSNMGAYSRSLLEFLGMRSSRERYMLILKDGNRIGYSGMRIERIEQGLEQEEGNGSDTAGKNEKESRKGKYRVVLDGFARILPWLGRKGTIEVGGELLLDELGEVRRVSVVIEAAGEKLQLRGKSTGSSLPVEVLVKGESTGITLTLPTGTGFGSGILPVPPLVKIEGKQELTVPYFDPLTRTQKLCKVRPLEKKKVNYKGVKVQAVILEVRVPAGTFKVTAATSGEILGVRGPGGIEFQPTSSTRAHALFHRRGKL